MNNSDGQSPLPNGSSLPPSRLGPKGNQGAINAQLRALDRSGAQCKRWQKAEFKLKSFTGVEWTVKTFKAEKKPKTDSQPATSDAASVASPESTAGLTPMEGIEQAPTPDFVNSDMPTATNGIEVQESNNFQNTLIAPVV